MNENASAKPAANEAQRVQFNTNKLEAALCIALSAAISIGIIAWLLS